MNHLHHIGLRLRSRFRHVAFMLKEGWLARHAGVRPLNILFSAHPGWEAMIREGFSRTPHSVSFGDVETAKLDGFDLVVPLSVDGVLALGRRAGRLWLPMPDPEVVHLCHDKLRLNLRLIDLGFGAHIPDLLEHPAPPFVVKKRKAENSEGSHLVLDDEDRLRHAALLDSADYFCQRIAEGRSEFASHVLFDGRRIVSEITVEYVTDRLAFIKGHEDFVTKTLARCPDPTLLRDMLRAIGFRGLCCLNYKLVDGRVQLLEINPRFGGSLSPLFFAMVRHLARLPVGRAVASPRAPERASGAIPLPLPSLRFRALEAPPTSPGRFAASR